MKSLHEELVVQQPQPVVPKPDATWTIEALLACALAFLAEAGILARKTTVAVLRAGLPLWLLRERLKCEKRWCKFQRERDLPRTSVWEAIELHLRVTEQGLTEDQVAAMPWPEAREFFGICGQRKQTADEPECPVSAEPVEAEQHGEGDAQPAEPAIAIAATAKKVAKQEPVDLSPCEIDAATAFVTAVGSWERAVVVVQSIKDIVGG
jgi:hypothetical protein